MFGGTVIMICNILAIIFIIFFAFGIIFLATHSCFSIIADFKTGINSIDEIICKIERCRTSKILVLLTIFCFEITFISCVMFISISVCIGGL